MAFVAANLHLRAGAPGDLTYTFDAVADTLATVAANGYFNNTDDDQNLTVDDRIWCQCADGNMTLRVSLLTAGVVTTQFAGGNIPIQASASGTAGPRTLVVGYYEIGSTLGSASRHILPAPYPGAEVQVRRGSGSGGHALAFDCGSGATAIVFDSVGSRRIRLSRTGESFHVVGSSTTRWRLRSLEFNATGASASAPGGASAVLIGT